MLSKLPRPWECGPHGNVDHPCLHHSRHCLPVPSTPPPVASIIIQSFSRAAARPSSTFAHTPLLCPNIPRTPGVAQGPARTAQFQSTSAFARSSRATRRNFRKYCSPDCKPIIIARKPSDSMLLINADGATVDIVFASLSQQLMFSVGCVLALLHATMPAELLLMTSELLLKGDRAPTQQPQDRETEGNNKRKAISQKSHQGLVGRAPTPKARAPTPKTRAPTRPAPGHPRPCGASQQAIKLTTPGAR